MRVPIGRPSTAVKPIDEFDAAAVAHRAHAGAVAEVGHHHPFGMRGELRQLAGDVLVGQAVKAVAADPLLAHRVGQGEDLRHRRLRAVEGGIEAGDLRQIGKLPRRSRGWRRDCAAGAAAPAARTAAVRPSPLGRAAPARSRAGRRGPPGGRRRRSGCRLRCAPASRSGSASPAAWSRPSASGQRCSPSTSPCSFLPTKCGALPRPSIWPLPSSTGSTPPSCGRPRT